MHCVSPALSPRGRKLNGNYAIIAFCPHCGTEEIEVQNGKTTKVWIVKCNRCLQERVVSTQDRWKKKENLK